MKFYLLIVVFFCKSNHKIDIFVKVMKFMVLIGSDITVSSDIKNTAHIIYDIRLGFVRSCYQKLYPGKTNPTFRLEKCGYNFVCFQNQIHRLMEVLNFFQYLLRIIEKFAFLNAFLFLKKKYRLIRRQNDLKIVFSESCDIVKLKNTISIEKLD